MRSFRTLIVGCLALAASFLVSHAPSVSAAPADLGIYVVSLDQLHADIVAVTAATSDAIVLPSPMPEVASLVDVAMPAPLKPEFAESYRTHGLNFLKPHLRC